MNQQQAFKWSLTAGGIALPLLLPVLVVTGAIDLLVGYHIHRLPDEEQFFGLLPILICFGSAFIAGLMIWIWPRGASIVYLAGGLISMLILGRYDVFHWGTGFLLPFALYVLGIVIVPLVRKAETPAATKGQFFLFALLFVLALSVSIAHGILAAPKRAWHSQFYNDICAASNRNDDTDEYFPYLREVYLSVELPPNLTTQMSSLPINLRSNSASETTTDALLKQIESCLRQELASGGCSIGNSSRYSYKDNMRQEGFVLHYESRNMVGQIEVREPEYTGWPFFTVIHEDYVPSTV